MPENPLRIALVSSSYAPYVGGVEEHVRQVAASLQALGHTVLVWTVDRGEHLGEGDLDGVRVRYLPTPLPTARPAGVLTFSRRAPAAWRAWRAALAEDRPDLLHVHCFGPNGVYAAALAASARLPLVVTSHGETFMDPDVFSGSRLVRFALKVTLRRADAVTGVSDAVLADLRTRFGLSGGQVVPNGVAVEPSAPLPSPTGATATIVAVGRIEAVKGFDLLVSALPLVRERVPGVRLRIGGSGSAEDALRAHAQTVGVDADVTFLGRLHPGAVAAEMAAADVVVIPSRREAFGIVLLEAWRSGTPVVAADRDGLAGLVRTGVDGLLVDPTDAAKLAESVVRLIEDPGLAGRLAAAGRARLAEFSWPAVATAYRQVYAAVRSAKRPGPAGLRSARH